MNPWDWILGLPSAIVSSLALWRVCRNFWRRRQRHHR